MVVFATTPFFVFNQVGGDEAMAGVVGAIQMAAYAVSCLLSARFVSRARNGLHWALFGVSLFILLNCMMPLSPRFVWCGALSFFSFAALGLVWPALHSWIGAEPVVTRRARRMTWFNIAAGLGFALSPLIGGPLYDRDYRLPFLALAFIGVTIMLVIKSLPRETDHFRRAGGDQAGDQELGRPFAANKTTLLVAWCALFMANVLVGATRSVYPKRITDLVGSGQLSVFLERTPTAWTSHGPATTFSWLASTLWITSALCFLVMGRTHRWHNQTGFLLWLQVLAGGAAWTLGYAHDLGVMIVCFAILGGNFGAAFFVAMFHSLANHSDKHGRAAITEGVLGAGCFAGSIGFGYAARQFGVAAPFLFAPGFIGAALALQLLLLRRRRTNTSCTTLETGPVRP